MYSYPIDFDLYTQDEAIFLIEFLALIEDANNKKIDHLVLVEKYKKYRNIINSISTEKQLDKDFEKLSGFSIFKTMKAIIK
jgi:uncharacterized protein YktA (UPF0223 family)